MKAARLIAAAPSNWLTSDRTGTIMPRLSTFSATMIHRKYVPK